jgi:GDP/UDP-N,N'-diacetylbacillosamine 2-epimerase (hydrolysing)
MHNPTVADAQGRLAENAASGASRPASLVASRRVLVLTGKRGGFGAMKPMLKAMRDASDIALQLVVTDQHERFGRTIKEVERDFAIAAAVDMEQADDSAYARAQALGRCSERITKVLHDLKPDLCLLYGDRGEVLATAMAATILGVPIAHLQGGDVSGSVDEQMRHAITKLAHLHFPSNAESARRILHMGEEPWRVHLVGDSHLDGIIAGDYAQPEQVAAALDLDLDRPVLIVLQHSETTLPDQSYDQMVETLKAVRDSCHQAVVVHPCSDPGYEGVIRAIRELAVGPQFRVRVNIEAPLFWGLQGVAAAMIGNSSAGLIETPSFRLPAINIGRRQEGRLHAENVLHVVHERGAIANALKTALSDEFKRRAAVCTQPYGDGLTGTRIISALRDLPARDRLLVKRFVV